MATSRRSPRAAFFHLFDDSATPAYALDVKRTLIYHNSALANWLGVTTDELVGKRCDFAASSTGPTPPSGEPVFSLGAPPKVFEGELVHSSVFRQSPTHESRDATFIPLLGEDGTVQGVVVSVGSGGDDTKDAKTGSSTSHFNGANAGAVDLHRQIIAFRERYRGEYALQRLIGNSPVIQLVRDRVALASESATRVVVTGGRGSGREHVARTIHYLSSSEANDGVERLAPLVPLDCELLDAELLQTTVAAFLRQSAELEIRGIPCLLLLEVDRLSRDAQDVLHNLLSVKELELRTMATSRVALSDLDTTQFRTDIASQLSTLIIRLPDLSERLEDIPLLLQYALEQTNAEGGKQVQGFSEPAIQQLLQYPWPGNVDELLVVTKEIHTAATEAVVRVEELPKQIRLGIDADEFPILPTESIELDTFLEDIERELVVRAIRQTGGNKAQAARLLGINRARLLRRIAHLGID